MYVYENCADVVSRDRKRELTEKLCVCVLDQFNPKQQIHKQKHTHNLI